MNQPNEALTDQEVHRISQLIESLDRSTLDYLQVDTGGVKVTISKGGAGLPVMASPLAAPAAAPVLPASFAAAPAAPATSPTPAPRIGAPPAPAGTATEPSAPTAGEDSMASARSKFHLSTPSRVNAMSRPPVCVSTPT